MNAAGLTTHTARGEALGVSHTTAIRVAYGQVPPSTRIIARSLDLLGCRFEDLYEITSKDQEAA